ncbi:MAG: helicase HerA-like domain-containing protein [Bacteroidota bacterium]
MPKQSQFIEEITAAYSFKGETMIMGAAMLGGLVVENATINLPLKTMNRHGLIAGATGTGKTKTLQVIAEGLSNASIPVLMMDIKGDLSGIGMEGEANEKIIQRFTNVGLEFNPAAFPVEFLTISEEKGTKMRSTVTEFGPILLSKILGLNENQEGLVSVIFKYCDDNKLPLLDLKDFIKVLQYVSNEGRKEIEADYGKIVTTSTGTILRKVIELQQQKADEFFGERSFEVDDLMRISDDGRGMISVMRVTDLQDRPKSFSTFMLSLLDELYGSMPEEGDLDKPKLVIFVDEAHLLFSEASSALLQKIETVIKLIRSKGIGIFFCTQNPTDVPAPVLAQLGLKVQHALRAFTANDRKAIKLTADNYPISEYYKTEDLITQLGIGEAFITALNEKGIPTPLVHVQLIAPTSRMGILEDREIDHIIGRSDIKDKYDEVIDTDSAYEILTEKLDSAIAKTESVMNTDTFEKVMKHPIVRQVGRTAASIITRSILGALGMGGKRKWF